VDTLAVSLRSLGKRGTRWSRHTNLLTGNRGHDLLDGAGSTEALDVDDQIVQVRVGDVLVKVVSMACRPSWMYNPRGCGGMT
jgi:hypothetical protein